jgi:hypothetical protein
MSPVKAIRKILAEAAVLGLALSVPAVGAASASTAPVIYDAHNDGDWQPYVQPGGIFFGNGGAPFLTGLHWSSWGVNGGWATGKLHMQAQPRCTPSYKCPYVTRWAGVYLSTVRLHGGTRYYARMAVEFRYAGKWRWDVGWFRNGFWVFPLTDPYL